jgi:hypothetical protein
MKSGPRVIKPINRDAEPGFAASGSSVYSRDVAKREPEINLNKGKCTDGRLIRFQIKQLMKLQQQVLTETNPERLAKLRKNVGIKSAFIAKLQGRYEGEHGEPATVGPEPGHASEDWNWESVTDLPGENDIEPWGDVNG